MHAPQDVWLPADGENDPVGQLSHTGVEVAVHDPFRNTPAAQVTVHAVHTLWLLLAVVNIPGGQGKLFGEVEGVHSPSKYCPIGAMEVQGVQDVCDPAVGE